MFIFKCIYLVFLVVFWKKCNFVTNVNCRVFKPSLTQLKHTLIRKKGLGFTDEKHQRKIHLFILPTYLKPEYLLSLQRRNVIVNRVFLQSGRCVRKSMCKCKWGHNFLYGTSSFTNREGTAWASLIFLHMAAELGQWTFAYFKTQEIMLAFFFF